MDKMLTPRETAEILRVTPETLAVWRCTKRVKIPYVKLGGKILYRQGEVEAFVAAGARQ